MIEFKIEEKEYKNYIKWILDHKDVCKIVNPLSQGAIGGALTYSFTPTNLGMIIKIKCSCGEEIDVTEYEHW